MIGKVVNTYKFPLLISVVVAVGALAATVTREPLEITFIILGAILGTFVLELDYFIYAYFLEPDAEFSKSLKAFIQDKDYKSTLNHILYNKSLIEDKTLNSALFQIVMCIIMLVVVFSPTSMLIKMLLISALANSIYRMSEEYFDGKIDTWFWAFKTKPQKPVFIAYTAILVCIIIFSFTVL